MILRIFFRFRGTVSLINFRIFLVIRCTDILSSPSSIFDLFDDSDSPSQEKKTSDEDFQSVLIFEDNFCR